MAQVGRGRRSATRRASRLDNHRPWWHTTTRGRKGAYTMRTTMLIFLRWLLPKELQAALGLEFSNIGHPRLHVLPSPYATLPDVQARPMQAAPPVVYAPSLYPVLRERKSQAINTM